MKKEVKIHWKLFRHLRGSAASAIHVPAAFPSLKARVFLLIATTSKTKQTWNCNLPGRFHLSKGDVVLGKMNKSLIFSYFPVMNCLLEREKIHRKNVKALQTASSSHQHSMQDQLSMPCCSTKPWKECDSTCFALLVLLSWEQDPGEVMEVATLVWTGMFFSSSFLDQAICWRKGRGGQCLRSLWNSGRWVGMLVESLTQLWNKRNKTDLLWGCREHYTSS